MVIRIAAVSKLNWMKDCQAGANVDVYFKKLRKLERSALMGAERIENLEKDIAHLTQLVDDIARTSVAQLQPELKRHGIKIPVDNGG